MALLPCLLLSCFDAQPSVLAKESTASVKLDLPSTAHEAPKQKICTTKTYYEVEGTRYSQLPWHLSPHDYSKRRFPDNVARKVNQQRTRKLISLTVRELRGSSDLLRFLKLIAIRESSLIGTSSPFDGLGVVHRLTADEESSVRSWQSQKENLSENPFIDNQGIWRTYGPYGMNASYSIYSFDKTADPRLLADTVAATIAQIKKIHFVSAKLDGEVLCPKWSGKSRKQVGWDGSVWTRGVIERGPEGNIVREKVFVPRNWYTIHRAVQSGKVCPAWRGDTLSRFLKNAFARRAGKMGLSPSDKVQRSTLGKAPQDTYQAWMSVWSKAGVVIEKKKETVCKE